MNRQQRLWAHIEPAASLPEEVNQMSKSAADPNDPVEQMNRAGRALRSIERRQKASFEKWGAAWKARRVEAIVDMSDDAFRMLRAGNVVTANDEKHRADARKAKELQEQTGNDETVSEDEVLSE